MSSLRTVDGWEHRLLAALPAGVRYTDVPDVAADRDDRIHLITRNDAHVITATPAGELLDLWSQVPDTGRLHGITVAANGDRYLVDDGNHCIRRFDLTGRLLQTIGTPGVGSRTGIDTSIADTNRRLRSIRCGAEPFNRPTRLAIGPSGDLFVTDGYGNARVHRFDPNGRLVCSWGEPGDAAGQFNLPHGVAVTTDERVLVADRENDRLQVFTVDGDVLDVWEGLQRPMGVVVASDRVFVVEGYRSNGMPLVRGRCTSDLPARISVFDQAGQLSYRLDSTVVGALRLRAPHGLAVDSGGCVYVAGVTPVAERSGEGGLVSGPGGMRVEKLQPEPD